MIRFAAKKDIPKISDLLRQVNQLHYNGRPDIFKLANKYTQSQIEEILKQEDKPVLVWVDSKDEVKGYCFCDVKQVKDSNLLTDIKTLYIDDLCVDESCRGMHIGKELYLSAVELAKKLSCYNLTLNVWSCNPSALKFYEAMGLKPQRIFMEQIL